MSRFYSLFVTKKTINITRPSKKTPKQSISYDFVAVTLAIITFYFFCFFIFFCETKFEPAILSEQPGDKSRGAGPY
jgi:hypothetical protein